MYSPLEFKGESTVTIMGGTTLSYVKDGNYIRINTSQGDLLFKIKDSKTLVGEGQTEGGLYQKQ